MTRVDFKKELEEIKTQLALQEFSRKQLQEEITSKTEQLENVKILKDKNNRAMLYLKARAADTRKSSLEAINGMITSALTSMYSEDYRFFFDYNEKALEQGEKSGYNITPKISSMMEGEIVTTGIIGSRGGGLCEIISVLLRWAFLKYLNQNSTMILDETFGAVSSDEKMINLNQFLKHYIEESGSQILFITHKAEVFGKYASKIYKVDKNDGVASISEISYTDILDHQRHIINEN